MEFHTDLDEQPRKVIEVNPHVSRPLWQKALFFVVLLGIIAGVIFAITTLINKSDSKETKKEASNSEDKVATETTKAKSDRCKPKQDLDNSQQGYQACYEALWQQKELKVSGLEIGLYKASPDSSFPGNINIRITDESEDLVSQNTSDNSSKFEFGKVDVGGKKSTQVVITRQKDDPLAAYPMAIVTSTAQNGRTYVFTLNSTEADFAADTALYEDFLSTVEFSDVKDPPWSDSRNIIVNQPWSGDSITSPVTVSGEAISFEAVVNIRIKDKNGKTLTETTLKTESGTSRSAFLGNITFDKGSASEGVVEVYNASAKDNAEQDKVSIPVKFK